MPPWVLPEIKLPRTRIIKLGTRPSRPSQRENSGASLAGFENLSQPIGQQQFLSRLTLYKFREDRIFNGHFFHWQPHQRTKTLRRVSPLIQQIRQSSGRMKAHNTNDRTWWNTEMTRMELHSWIYKLHGFSSSLLNRKVRSNFV